MYKFNHKYFMAILFVKLSFFKENVANLEKKRENIFKENLDIFWYGVVTN